MAVIGMGGVARVVGFWTLALMWLPALAVVPAAVVDRGPDGTPRVSPLPIALAALDPFAWACAANSVLAASAVAFGSLAIGVGLGMVLDRGRFWGRPVLSGLAWAPLAAGPVVVAPGVALILGGANGGGWDWLDARSIAGVPFSDLARWAGLVWVGLAGGVPTVALTTLAARAKLEPAWADAARAVGASRRRIWRDLTWPILRPDVARAVSAVFALALLEPAAPLVLGLRRTLAVRVVESARRLDAPTHAATLALLAIALATLARVLIGWWAGASVVRAEADESSPPRRASTRLRALATAAILGTWIAFGLAPVVAVLARALAPEDGEGRWPAMARALRPGPEAIPWFGNALVVASIALAMNALALASLAGRPDRPPGRVARGLSSALGWFPPLAIGVGALALPWLLAALADAIATGPALGSTLRALAQELHPARSPGVVLILAMAATHMPMLARAAVLARGPTSPRLVDAALSLGASRGRAARDRSGPPSRLVPARPAALTLALAMTNLAPALLLTPLPERRTPAPAVLGLVLDGGPIDGRVAAPVVAILAVNLVAFALASRGRAGPIGGWFRGG